MSKAFCNYDITEVGKNLVKFINGIETVKTDIGKCEKSSSLFESDFIITGVQIDRTDNIVNILSTVKTSINVENKFNSFEGLNCIQILNSYLEENGLKKLKKEITNKFRDINSNKLLIMPFKLGDECEVEMVIDRESGGKKEKVIAPITLLSWRLNKDTGKICGEVIVKLNDNTKSVKHYFDEYGKDFKIVSIERSLKNEMVDRNIIEMDYFGFIKPIELYDSKVRLAIDSTNLYKIEGDNVYIIGCWDTNGKIKELYNINDIKKSKAYLKLINSLEYIEKHRRFIAPYKLVDANEIKVK